MNKVMLMGRLVKDPEVKYSQSNQDMAIARYTLAVKRRFVRQGEPDTDFINCIAFGKTGQFAEKYLRKGQMIAVSGALRISSWDDPNTNQKKWFTDVIVEEHYFAESKNSSQQSAPSMDYDPFMPPAEPKTQQSQENKIGYTSIPDPTLDDLPF